MFTSDGPVVVTFCSTETAVVALISIEMVVSAAVELAADVLAAVVFSATDWLVGIGVVVATVDTISVETTGREDGVASMFPAETATTSISH